MATFFDLLPATTKGIIAAMVDVRLPSCIVVLGTDAFRAEFWQWFSHYTDTECAVLCLAMWTDNSFSIDVMTRAHLSRRFEEHFWQTLSRFIQNFNRHGRRSSDDPFGKLRIFWQIRWVIPLLCALERSNWDNDGVENTCMTERCMVLAHMLRDETICKSALNWYTPTPHVFNSTHGPNPVLRDRLGISFNMSPLRYLLEMEKLTNYNALLVAVRLLMCANIPAFPGDDVLVPTVEAGKTYIDPKIQRSNGYDFMRMYVDTAADAVAARAAFMGSTRTVEDLCRIARRMMTNRREAARAFVAADAATSAELVAREQEAFFEENEALQEEQDPEIQRALDESLADRRMAEIQQFADRRMAEIQQFAAKNARTFTERDDAFLDDDDVFLDDVDDADDDIDEADSVAADDDFEIVVMDSSDSNSSSGGK